MTHDEYRRALSQITDDRDVSLWWPDIQQLTAIYHHTIRPVHLHFSRGLNCFAYALGLGESRAYLAIARCSQDPNVFADPTFVRFLLTAGKLTPACCDPAVIIYFSESQPRHAGVVCGGRVTSKWGTGDWYEHDVFDVPAQYGTETELYVLPHMRDIELAFVEFARQAGARVDHLLPRTRRGTYE